MKNADLTSESPEIGLALATFGYRLTAGQK